MIDLKNLTIEKAHQDLKEGKYKVLDLVNAYKKVISEKNPDLNAYLSIWTDAENQAQIAQKMFDENTATTLTGIPFSIKDVITTKGQISTGGSKILENHIPAYDATVVEKLKTAGAIILGKTNTDEFAQGSSTENSAYGVTKNPHDTTRVAGGSSGGSAVSVAMDGALASLGTDTGGSVRQPASFCGVVGLKPTYGTVSRYGLMAMASSFDVAGPFSKTVADSEIIFNAIKGIDPLDSTTVAGTIDADVKTIGVPRSFLKEGIDPDVLQNFEDSLKKLELKGYKIKDIEIPLIEYSLAVYYILVPAEVSSNMARYDGIKFGERVSSENLSDHYTKTRGQLLGPEVKRRIMLGTYVLSAGYSDQFYNKAWQARNAIKKSFEKVFSEVDCIAMPVFPEPATKIGANDGNPLKDYLADIFTVPANVAGIPAISIPSGTVDRDGKSLPVGLQLLAPHFGENRLFSVGKRFEE